MNKKLVVYFSATGTTRSVAKSLARVLECDIHEIQPTTKYTSEDLDWTNKKSRSSIEMDDKNSRPSISNSVENINEYNVIYIGFPIWWYVAPTIINTFLESYDLHGKKIIPFATSGGSGMGKTCQELKRSCLGAVLLEGRRFPSNIDDKTLRSWALDVIKD